LISGGEIDSVDKDGNTPLHVAARYGHELLINTLITSGADCTRCSPAAAEVITVTWHLLKSFLSVSSSEGEESTACFLCTWRP